MCNARDHHDGVVDSSTAVPAVEAANSTGGGATAVHPNADYVRVNLPGYNAPPPWSVTPSAKKSRFASGPAGPVIAAIKFVLIVPIKIYQTVCRPIMPPLCRYKPSCSDFMMQAIQQKGIVWGLILGTYRILRCNPFGNYGYDPVEAWPPYWTGKKWVWRRPPISDWPIPAPETTESADDATPGDDGPGAAADALSRASAVPPSGA